MLVYVVFFVLTFTSGVFSSLKPPPCDSEPSCPKHEHFTRNNPRCIRTCANKCLPVSDNCKPFTGCVCNGGRVRLNDDASGPCILENKCRRKCSDPNEVYRECPSACPLTCDQPNPRPCTKNCGKEHCECVPGFVRNEITGRCVRPKDCPGKKCRDPNAVYKICPSACPLTCAKPNPGACPAVCGKKHCECVSGFVLNEATGRCVRPKDCPGKKCRDPNAVYKICPSACPLTCAKPNREACPTVCGKKHCECVSGFVLNEATGRCVRPADCPCF